MTTFSGEMGPPTLPMQHVPIDLTGEQADQDGQDSDGILQRLDSPEVAEAIEKLRPKK